MKLDIRNLVRTVGSVYQGQLQGHLQAQHEQEQKQIALQQVVAGLQQQDEQRRQAQLGLIGNIIPSLPVDQRGGYYSQLVQELGRGPSPDAPGGAAAWARAYGVPLPESAGQPTYASGTPAAPLPAGYWSGQTGAQPNTPAPVEPAAPFTGYSQQPTPADRAAMQVQGAAQTLPPLTAGAALGAVREQAFGPQQLMQTMPPYAMAPHLQPQALPGAAPPGTPPPAPTASPGANPPAPGGAPPPPARDLFNPGLGFPAVKYEPFDTKRAAAVLKANDSAVAGLKSVPASDPAAYMAIKELLDRRPTSIQSQADLDRAERWYTEFYGNPYVKNYTVGAAEAKVGTAKATTTAKQFHSLIEAAKQMDPADAADPAKIAALGKSLGIDNLPEGFRLPGKFWQEAGADLIQKGRSLEKMTLPEQRLYFEHVRDVYRQLGKPIGTLPAEVYNKLSPATQAMVEAMGVRNAIGWAAQGTRDRNATTAEKRVEIAGEKEARASLNRAALLTQTRQVSEASKKLQRAVNDQHLLMTSGSSKYTEAEFEKGNPTFQFLDPSVIRLHKANKEKINQAQYELDHLIHALMSRRGSAQSAGAARTGSGTPVLPPNQANSASSAGSGPVTHPPTSKVTITPRAPVGGTQPAKPAAGNTASQKRPATREEKIQQGIRAGFNRERAVQLLQKNRMY